MVHADLHRRHRKENIVLRSSIDPRAVYVVPNAVVASSFLPDPSKAPPLAERSELNSVTSTVVSDLSRFIIVTQYESSASTVLSIEKG